MQSSFTPPQPPLGIALVGTGFGQKVHLPALQHHPATQVVAVYHRDLAKAKAIAAAHEIPHACDAIAALVALPEVDGVSLSTPPFLHYEIGKKILEAGKHLLLEKPTAMNAIEARELYKLAQAQNLRATLNFEFRYVPAWMRLQELLAEGYVGQKRLIKIDWLVAGRADPHRPWSWHASKSLGGGALGALASHTFDYICWLFGPIKQLCARLNLAIPFRPDPVSGLLKAVDAEDTCTLLLELKDGTPLPSGDQFRHLSGPGALGRSLWRSRHPDSWQQQSAGLCPRLSTPGHSGGARWRRCRSRNG